MTSKAKMIVQYEWILENVGEEPMTIASKMILFRDERVFRVGLKNYADVPILFLVAINLRKMGMKVKDVKFGMKDNGIGPAKMEEMTKEDLDDEGSLQLFTVQLEGKVLGNCEIMFRICIGGIDSYYSYQLSDRLAKDQLWAALITQKHLADVELIVKDKIFPAHKAILAARSRVFADEFERVQLDVPHQIRIDGVEPSTVENFLHFIYTGEAIGTLADEKLFQLADHYQLTTLANLCQLALMNIDALQIANIMKRLNDNNEKMSSSKITPEKETEIFFDRTTPTFRCSLKFKKYETEQSKCVMQYQNANIFIAYLTGERLFNTDDDCYYVDNPVIHLSCAKHRNFGLKVEDIYCDLDEGNDWLKMESQYFQENAEILHLAAKSYSNFCVDSSVKVDFDIKVVSTIGNYYYEMMDKHWLKDLWLAATNQKLTDVEIFVGTVKVMEVHRIIVCARSPVLNESLNKTSNTEKSTVTFGAEFEVEIVQNFLNFLYTGSLKTINNGEQLSKLATMYQVETLKNVCQLLNANPPDAENITDYLLQL